MKPHTPAAADPEAIPVARPLRYDWQAEGAVEAIAPTINRLARIVDHIAQRRAHQDAGDTDQRESA